MDHDLNPHKEFIGMDSVTETTGESLPKVALDVLCRLNLTLSAWTDDGAANMSGRYSGKTATSFICALWSALCEFSSTEGMQSF